MHDAHLKVLLASSSYPTTSIPTIVQRDMAGSRQHAINLLKLTFRSTFRVHDDKTVNARKKSESFNTSCLFQVHVINEQ